MRACVNACMQAGGSVTSIPCSRTAGERWILTVRKRDSKRPLLLCVSRGMSSSLRSGCTNRTIDEASARARASGRACKSCTLRHCELQRRGSAGPGNGRSRAEQRQCGPSAQPAARRAAPSHSFGFREGCRARCGASHCRQTCLRVHPAEQRHQLAAVAHAKRERVLPRLECLQR